MATQQFFHETTIACEPEVVFDYITAPRHWHEWFSSSLPSRVKVEAQRAGQRFEMMTAQRPLGFAPFKLPYPLHCTVSKSDRPYLWEVEAESDLVTAVTSYTLSHTEEGSIVKRQFRYATKGWLRYAEPLLFRKWIVSQASQSLEKLKKNLERDCR